MSSASETGSASRLEQLTRQLREALGDERLCVEAWRQGVDFWADLAMRDGERVGVLRSPRQEVLQTSYEGTVDFADTLAKEIEVLDLLKSRGVPVPGVHAWRRRRDAGERSWMLCEHIVHQPATRLDTRQERDLGRWTRKIHAIHPQSATLARAPVWCDAMLTRLEGRLSAAHRHCADIPVTALLAQAGAVFAERQAEATSLLHMDLRPENLCIADGRIEAIIDVANAMVGDPWLELGRIRAYGLLTPAFLEGYGLSPSALAPMARPLGFYEIETCALLMTVAVEEADLPELFETSRHRAIELADTLVRRGTWP